MQNLIEHMAELARHEAEQEFAAKTVAWEQRLLDAERRATRAEEQAALAIEAKEAAVSDLAVLQAALRSLLPS